ncbi:MAG: 1,4-alpha-glucan branching protein GlgB [Lachnospiraceae bacterium]|nr:1,4-alpha-glucan branching protein GlgB [Lachnospiraceae bacterium]
MRQEIGEKIKIWDVNRIQYGDTDNPHEVLGRHMVSSGQVISAFHPDAVWMKVKMSDGTEYEMEPAERTQVYSAFLPHQEVLPYRIEMGFSDGHSLESEDPYSFEPQISDLDMYLFGKGTHYKIYDKLGAHPMTIDGVKGTYFAVWAPNAKRVSVVGDFNLWDGRVYPMRRLGSIGIFEVFLPGVEEGTIYKYEIKTERGDVFLKSDPYGNACELRPKTASVVADLSKHQWTDQPFMKKRAKGRYYEEPMSIYEVHPGSWKRKGKDGEKMLSYRELAKELTDYVKMMGYTHVELMGIAEHPFDGSWGYQVTGYYAPTARYGSPEDFMYFVDYLHNHGISVILDWVPGHFPKDGHGLAKFDGSCLYEHPDTRKGEQPEWDTLVFNYERNEVRNFLIANALFWMKKFHIDGIRVDAVASMLYLDYGRKEGQWVKNQYGGNEYLEAVEFLKHLTSMVTKEGEGGYIIAEESTAWKGVSVPPECGGLGFQFKWNMGWMHDFLEYMSKDPIYRKYDHYKLTFSMMYAYSEHFVLVLSHDEVVHMKGSMINKMPGEFFDKFANLRVAYGFMFAHPGKKLLFMGQEFGQWAEWDEKKSLDWHLLKEDMHQKLQNYMSHLLHLYKDYKAFYEGDYDSYGFEWINCDDSEKSYVSFVRRTKNGKKSLLFICNFVPVAREGFRVGVPNTGKYKLILNSDEEQFGGNGIGRTKESQMAKKIEWDGKEQSIEMDLPPLGMLVFEYTDRTMQKKNEKKEGEK